MLNHILDIFFVVFHTSVILFNLFGWIWKRTRLANLVLLLLTGGSWLILGLIVGSLGYCPLTDWHFKILQNLGQADLPNSYIKYMVHRLMGINLDAHLVDTLTLIAFLAALGISLALNLRAWSKKAQRHNGTTT